MLSEDTYHRIGWTPADEPIDHEMRFRIGNAALKSLVNVRMPTVLTVGEHIVMDRR